MIADEATLAALMLRAQAGDRAAYAVLLRESALWLERFFRRRIPAEQIDDLVQDTLMSLHRKLASHDPARAYLPWLAAIARYRWVDHLRRVYRAAEGHGDDAENTGPHDDAVLARISIDRLLARLSPAQAVVISAVKIDGQSIAEAAAASGQSEALVKVNIHRGLKKLAALIEKAE